MTTLNATFPSTAATTYRNDDLPFSAYLHASRKLRFVGCEVDNIGHVTFVFADPDNQGDELHLAYEAGAECGAAALYDSIRRLRRVMDGTKFRSTRSNEQHEHESRPR